MIRVDSNDMNIDDSVSYAYDDYDWFHKVYDFWFNSELSLEDRFKLWFGKLQSNDDFITNNFKQTFDLVFTQCKDGTLDLKPQFEYSKIINISSIIVLDQFSRHIYRNSNNSLIDDATLQAVKLSKNCLEKFFYTLSDNELAFVLMPLKHFDINEYYCFIRDKIDQWKRYNCNTSTILGELYTLKMLHRFRFAY